MRHRPTLVALALTGALGLAPMGLMAQDGSSDQNGGSSSSSSGSSSSSSSDASGSSGQSADSSQSGGQQQSGNPFLRTVDEAYTAMRQVRAARLSIFEGEIDTAKELVQAAIKDMESAQSMLDKFSMPSGQLDGQSGGQAGDSSGDSSGSQQASSGGSDGGSGSGSGSGSGGNGQRYLPIDLSIGVAEGYLIPEDRTDALAQANAAFLRGDRRAATRILRGASIDVIVQASMIPAQKSLDNLKQADELMGQEKFYEANVALKAIEDSVTMRSFGLDAMPRQGRGGQGGQGGSQSNSGG